MFLILGACGTGEAATSTTETGKGAALYERHCAACHGIGGDGSGSGPPLTDARYAQALFPDAGFVAAVELGVEEGEWGLGPMGSIAGISHSDIAAITDHIRLLQEG